MKTANPIEATRTSSLAMTTTPSVLPRTVAGSVLWGRVGGFVGWLSTFGPVLTNRELRMAIYARYGRRPSRRSVEALRRSYDVPMTFRARRRAYTERDGWAFAPASPAPGVIAGRASVVRTVSAVMTTRVLSNT